MSEQKSDLIEIGALWWSKDKKWLSGKFGNAKLLVFENKNKKEDKHPDYKMFVAPYKKKDEAKIEPAKVSDSMDNHNCTGNPPF